MRFHVRNKKRRITYSALFVQVGYLNYQIESGGVYDGEPSGTVDGGGSSVACCRTCRQKTYDQLDSSIQIPDKNTYALLALPGQKQLWQQYIRHTQGQGTELLDLQLLNLKEYLIHTETRCFNAGTKRYVVFQTIFMQIFMPLIWG